jgi:hypothetical protein
MANKADIVNYALLKLGHSPVISVETDTTETGVAARAVYDLSLQDLLAAHPWNFATIRTSLAELVHTQVGSQWTHAYQVPNDCLRILMVEPEGVQYTVNGRMILANTGAPLVIVYLKNETDTSLYSPQFSIALSYRIAMELSTALSGRDSFKAAFTQEYFQKLQEAKATDGLEEGPTYEDHNPFGVGRFWDSSSVWGSKWAE